MKRLMVTMSTCLVATLFSVVAKAQNEGRCNEIRRRIADKGLLVDVTFRATELFDATQVTDYRRVIKLEPNVGLGHPGEGGLILTDGCSSIVSKDGRIEYYGFTIGKEVRLDIDGRKLAAAIPGEVMFISELKQKHRNRDQPWESVLRILNGNDSSVEIYHAVGAELMRGFAFDTWEGAGASNYSKLIKLPDSDLPSHSVGGNVLGVAGRGSRLYQVSVQRYSVDIAP